MVKKLTSLSIDEDVLKDAKQLGNISKILQEHLRDITTSNPDLIYSISTCRLCKKKKNIKEMFKFDPPRIEFKNDEGRILVVTLFVCKECFVKVKHNQIKSEWDKETLDVMKDCILEEQEHQKVNETPEIIEKVKQGKIRYYVPFEDAIGLYDASDGEPEQQQNDIKSFIKEVMVEYPLADWRIEKGKISVPLGDINEFHASEEDIGGNM